MPVGYYMYNGQVQKFGDDVPPGAVPVPPPGGAPAGAPTAGADYADDPWLRTVGSRQPAASDSAPTSIWSPNWSPLSPVRPQFYSQAPDPADVAPPPPAAAPAGVWTSGYPWTVHELPNSGGAKYYTDAAGNVMTKSQAPPKWLAGQTYARNWGQVKDNPFVQMPDASDSGWGIVGDLFNMANIQFENFREGYQNDPERAVLGINTPFESEIWGAALGKDYEPLHNDLITQGSIYTDKDFEDAQKKKNVDLDTVHIADMIARQIAMFYGGQALNGVGGAAAAETAPVAEQGMLSQMLSQLPEWAPGLAKTYGLNFLASGGDPVAAAKSTAISAGVNYGANAAAPYLNSTVDYFNGANDFSAPADVSGYDPRRTQLASADTGMFDVGAGPLMPPAIQPDPAFGMMPAAQPAGDPTFGGTLAESAPGVYTPVNPTFSMPAAVPESGDPTNPPPEPARSNITPEDLKRYLKAGQQVAALLGDKAEAEGPQRPAEDASPEDQQRYLADVVKYLGLDAQTMADAGLVPGSPEYTAYILDQADTIIAQVLGDLDVDSADLAQQLRAKTDKELQALQRALYVRGQLGQQMGAGTYTDPATGNAEDVIGPGMFNPSTAAYQRGLAGSVDKLAGARGADAYRQLQGMLGRDADLFGMQAQQNQRFEQAMRDDEQRRRGMLAY